MGWFDDPANALGVLTSRLAVDIKLIRLTVGQGTGSTVSSMTALLAGLIIALIAAWQFALAFLATMVRVPCLHFDRNKHFFSSASF